MLTAFSSSKPQVPAQGGEETVWIRRSDGGLSCSPEKAQSLEDAAGELKKARISVLDSRKGHDGKMRIQMCGAPAGTENAYKIHRSDLPRAVALGFAEEASSQASK